MNSNAEIVISVYPFQTKMNLKIIKQNFVQTIMMSQN